MPVAPILNPGFRRVSRPHHYMCSAGTDFVIATGTAIGLDRAGPGDWDHFVPVSYTHLDVYKRQVTDRADPFAFATEVPPHTASRVFTSDYTWTDADWMTKRAKGCLLYTSRCV